MSFDGRTQTTQNLIFELPRRQSKGTSPSPHEGYSDSLCLVFTCENRHCDAFIAREDELRNQLPIDDGEIQPSVSPPALLLDLFTCGTTIQS